jgi:hypothetical protein
MFCIYCQYGFKNQNFDKKEIREAHLNKRYYKSLIVLGSLLYPIYALPWVFKLMIKNEKLGYILFSLSMAYSAYLMIPYFDFDLTRHYDDFIRMTLVDFSDILVVDPRPKHYFFNVYMWLIHQLGFSKQFVPFFITFAKYFFLFLSFRKILEAYPIDDTTGSIEKKWYMIIFLILLIGTIQFVRDVSGLRNNLAFAVFIYGVLIYYIDRKYFSSIMLFILAIGIHLSIIPLVLLFYLSLFLSKSKTLRIVFIISLIILLTGMADNLFFGIMNILKPFLKANGLYFSYYMSPEGKWGAGYFADKGIATLLLEKYIRPSAFYFAAVYLLLVRNLTFEKIKSFLYIVFIFVVLVSVSRTMLDRYSYFYKFLFLFVLMSEYATKPFTKFKKYFLIFLILITITTKMISIYRYGAVYIDSWTETLYVPAPIMLLRDIVPEMYIKEPYLK